MCFHNHALPVFGPKYPSLNAVLPTLPISPSHPFVNSFKQQLLQPRSQPFFVSLVHLRLLHFRHFPRRHTPTTTARTPLTLLGFLPPLPVHCRRERPLPPLAVHLPRRVMVDNLGHRPIPLIGHDPRRARRVPGAGLPNATMSALPLSKRGIWSGGRAKWLLALLAHGAQDGKHPFPHLSSKDRKQWSLSVLKPPKPETMVSLCSRSTYHGPPGVKGCSISGGRLCLNGIPSALRKLWG